MNPSLKARRQRIIRWVYVRQQRYHRGVADASGSIGQHQAAYPLRFLQRHPQAGNAAHGLGHQNGSVDLQVIQQRQEIAAHRRRVGRAGGAFGKSPSPLVESDTAKILLERGHLSPPAQVIPARARGRKLSPAPTRGFRKINSLR